MLSLIQDLAELEALENTVDLKAARDALGKTEEPVPWEKVKTRLDAQFRSRRGFDFARVRHLAGSIASRATAGLSNPGIISVLSCL